MSAPAKAGKGRASDTQDEIEQIMSEIEQLQQEIDSTDVAAAPAVKPAAKFAAPAPRAVASAPTTVAAKPVATAPAKLVAARPAPVAVAKAPETEIEIPVEEEIEPEPESNSESEPLETLADLGFGIGTGGGSDSSLEDTLGDLKEEPSSGNGALDVVNETDEEQILEEESPVAAAIAAAAREEESELAPTEVEEPVDEQNVSDEDFASAEAETEEEIMNHRNPQAPIQTPPAEEGTLTMTLKGNMTLKLQYDCEGQMVTVGFADGALKIALADGTEFKIPVGRGKAPLRRVA